MYQRIKELLEETGHLHVYTSFGPLPDEEGFPLTIENTTFHDGAEVIEYDDGDDRWEINPDQIVAYHDE